MASNVNIVLVHGAFCDGSSWSRVIPLLEAVGDAQIIAVQLPLVGLSNDIATVQQALVSLSGPTILVGHSYGGAVISGVIASNVVGLVYIAAYVPAEGENLQILNDRFAGTEGQKHIGPAYLENTVWIDPKVFPQVFAVDVDREQARIMVTVQKPTGFGCLGEKLGQPAWQKVPSWYLVSDNDQTINPDAERWMAQRINATTRSIPASHASPVSHPREVANLIATASQAISKA